MLSHTLKTCVCLVLLGSFMTPAMGQAKFWFADAGTDFIARPPIPGELLELEIPLGGSRDLHLWTQPEPGRILQNFSLNIVSSSDTALQFDVVEIVNENQDGSRRFEHVLDTLNGLDIAEQAVCFGSGELLDVDSLPTHAVWGFRGFSIADDAGTGVTAPNDRGVLLATVTVSASALGSTDLSLQIGEIGINQAGEATSELEVQLGSPDDAFLDAKLNRCQASATPETTISIVEPMLGDFDLDGTLDADDMDLLSAEVLAGAHTSKFRITDDVLVNSDDRTFWIETLKGSFFGDADLNGSVDFADFLSLSMNFLADAGWAGGDFDGNARVEFPDFLALSANFGQPRDVASTFSAVPEPGAGVLCCLALCLAFGRQARRK